ncbi:YgfZ/GcvT domain-containing protein [Rubritalea marina]|uniref:CAF17-like 4Fe-4S cluster assembly/insertion protein YgfZ n=1 Tax=Rubritalea marina TaxID=361055 RepID=UPI00036C4D57|nr:folate-binding protein YgfZ [Rubritalea marina]
MPSPSIALLNRTIFHLTGEDAQRYLSGQCSQDLSLATPEAACYATILNHKGKMDADIFVRAHHGGLLVDAAPELREELHLRLDRYIIADDVEITDLSDNYRLLHAPLAEHLDSSAPRWSVNRFGQTATEQLVETSQAPEANLTLEALEEIRIANMVPAWGAELGNDTLPPEAGLEDRAISYSKGCYTGQEVISRMRSAGRTNRKLAMLELDALPEIPAPLLADGATLEKPAGTLTSATTIDGKHIGLAFIAKKFYSETEFQIGTSTARLIKTI